MKKSLKFKNHIHSNRVASPTQNCMLDYLEFSVGKLREVARSFGIIFSLSSQKVLVWFCRRTSYCISGGIFADTHTHDPLGALDCNSNRVLPSFDHFTQKWLLLIES